MNQRKSFNREPLRQAIKENLLWICAGTALLNVVVWFALDLFAPDLWLTLAIVGFFNSAWLLLLLGCWWWQGKTNE